MKIKLIKILAVRSRSYAWVKWQMLVWSALLVSLLAMTGCNSMGNIPIFGSKPPVASSDVQDRGSTADRRHAVQSPELFEPSMPVDSSPRKVSTSSNKTATSGDDDRVVAESNLPPAPLTNVLGGEEIRDENSQKQPRIIEKTDVDFIAGRLHLYRQKMTAWNELAGGLVKLDMGGVWPDGWYGCVQNLEMVFAGYRRLWQFVSNDSSNTYDHSRAGGISTVYQRDIEYLESDCDELMTTGQVDISRKVAGFKDIIAKQSADLIWQYIDQGENINASQAYENFIKIYGNAKATNKMKMLYSKALMRQGRLAAALAPLADIWGKEVGKSGEVKSTNAHAYDRGRTADLLNINKVGIAYADLLMANNRPEKARQIYDVVARNLASGRDLEVWVKNQQLILSEGGNAGLLDTYVQILRSFYRFNGTMLSDEFARNLEKINNAGSKSLSANTKIIARKIAVLVGRRIDEQLLKIDELIGGREFSQARSMADKLVSLVAQNNDILLADDRLVEVSALKDRIAEAEMASSEARLQLDKQRAERQWQTAVDLLDRREYKAAIAAFRQLSTSEYAAEASAKISEAANMKAVETRREAASLFFKARKTNDPKLKKQLMMQSRDLLRQVVEEYPDVEIIDKIKRNLQVLDEQLNENGDMFDKGK